MMMIGPLPKAFIILTAFVQNVLYVYEPTNVVEVRICFAGCNQWRSLIRGHIYDEITNVSRIEIQDASIRKTDVLRFKLQLVFDDGTIGETPNWKQILVNDGYIFNSNYAVLFILTGVLICKLMILLIYFIAKCREKYRGYAQTNKYS